MERFPGWRMRLLKVIDFVDMLGRVRELETDALAMPAGRKAPALDHGDPCGMPACLGSWVIV